MKKRVIKAGMFLMLTFVVSLLVYVETPDDSVYVTELNLTKYLPDSMQQSSSDSEDQVWETCDSAEDAGEALREALRERKTEVTLMLSGDEDKSDYNALFNQIYSVALEHTGEGDEGDYLKWHLSKIDVTYAKSSSAFDISVDYLDDDVMEQQTTYAIAELEQSLQITSEDSTYDKIYKIYDYLANNITYDDEDESDLPHTAYDAVVNGRAVCQGYALVFYRMLLDYGIDNRLIVSDTHAWNLVDLDGEYYECDLTWDSQEIQEGNPYTFFMKADLSEDNSAHDWKSEALDSEVYTLERAAIDYDTGDDDGISDISDVAYLIKKKILALLA